MMKQKGFTLIELLVVIAIIALLLSVIIPSLNMAKRKAQGAVCVANLSGLTKAWALYAGDNNDELVGAFTGTVNKPYFSWVQGPLDRNDKPLATTDGGTIEEKIRGLEKGLFYAYVEAPDVYHCPGDNRSLKPAVYPGVTGLGGYRTYSMVGGVRGAGYNGQTGEYEGWGVVAHKKISTIKSPGSKYILVEEMDGRGWNRNAWVINPSMPDDWVDPIGIWHGDSSTFGFADGHGERHKWHQPEVIKMAEEQTFHLTARGEDTEWVHRGYPYLRRL